jgi:putative membrane protein
MKRASDLFNDSDRQRINDAVNAAEAKTSGEIVPVVSTESGRYDRAEDLAGFVIALLLLTAAWFVFQGVASPIGRWDEGPFVALGLTSVVLIMIGGAFVGSAVAARINWLRRLFVSKAEMLAEVNEAARAAFTALRVYRTDEGTGILIYASLFERMVVVMGEEGIAAKLEPEIWEKIRDTLIVAIRSGRPTDGFVSSIELCAEHLAVHFPIRSDDINELSDELHIID